MAQDRAEVDGDRAAEPAIRLLVVDDDAAQRAIICKIGTQLGYHAADAGGFDEAIARLSAERFDCITLDLSLGKHDGVELMRAIDGDNRRASIVVISGCHEQVLTAAMRAGHSLGLSLHGPLTKPVNLGVLRQFLALIRTERTTAAKPAAASIGVEDFVRAANAGEVTVDYRPRVAFAGGALVGCEAVVAWTSPKFGEVPFDVVEALAAKAQLTARLAEEVLQSALAGAAEVVRRVPGFGLVVRLPFQMAADPATPDRIAQMLRAAGLPAGALTVAVADPGGGTGTRKLADALGRLRGKGLRTALAEFGVAPVALPLLAALPVSEMQIDPRLTAKAETDAVARRIVGAAVLLALQFDTTPSAGAVGDARLWARLGELGCVIGTGPVVAPAVDRTALPGFVDAWQARVAAPAARAG